MAKINSKSSSGFDILYSEIEALRPTYPYTRCGKVKRAPTLSELEGDDVDYYLTDDAYYEDRR